MYVTIKIDVSELKKWWLCTFQVIFLMYCAGVMVYELKYSKKTTGSEKADKEWSWGFC